MLDKDYYAGKDPEYIYRDIVNMGFTPQLIQNPANFIYPVHTHAATKVLAILEGSMLLTIEDVEYECTISDRIVIPGNLIHSAVVGELGCKFYWSEKLI